MNKDFFLPLWADFFHSSIVETELHVRMVFLFLGATSDADGYCRYTVKALARQANVTIDQAEDALRVLQEEDELSTNQTEGGVRVKSMGPNLWWVVNKKVYRQRFQELKRKEDNTKRKRESRSNDDACGQERTHADASGRERTEADPVDVHVDVLVDVPVDVPTPKKKTKKFTIPTAKKVQTYLDELSETRFTGQQFVDSNDAKGWVVGTTQTPMKDWKAVARTWISRRNEDSKPVAPEPGGTDYDSAFKRRRETQ